MRSVVIARSDAVQEQVNNLPWGQRRASPEQRMTHSERERAQLAGRRNRVIPQPPLLCSEDVGKGGEVTWRSGPTAGIADAGNQPPDIGESLLHDANRRFELIFEWERTIDRLQGALRGLRIERCPQRGLEDRLFVGKDAKNRPFGNPCRVRDLASRDVGAPFKQQRQGCSDDGLSSLFRGKRWRTCGHPNTIHE